jgi:hypothetical protein
MGRARSILHFSFGVATLLVGGVVAASGTGAGAAGRPLGPASAAEAFFESKIRPLLVEKCYSCHSASSPAVKSGLRLDTREGLLAGGIRGPSVAPGDPDGSPLIRAVTHTDPNLKMPPGGRLADVEIEALKAWVKAGAPWPLQRVQGSGFRVQADPRAPRTGSRAKASGSTPNTQHPTRNVHWAFQPIKMPLVPKVKNTTWVRNPIDAFVLAKLEPKGLHPAPPADARTLIRRVTFDLTGLPPTPAEVESFVRECREEALGVKPWASGTKPRSAETFSTTKGLPLRPNALHLTPGTPRQNSLAPISERAHERLVDRLLGSPAYGERWGRHWLDVARYADSNGLDENLVYLNAWRYRDYVIRAFNQDRPIDRFIQEQIAGDLLPPGDGDDFDRIVATGFLALGAKMLAEDDPVKQEEDIIDEQVDTLGKAFMGMTIGCARCHDHKFDPFPQTDYYALAGIFKSTRTMSKFQVVAEWQEVPLVSAAERQKLERIERELKAKRDEGARVRREAGEAALADATGNAARYLAAAREHLENPLTPVLETFGATVPEGARPIEAEDFARGNVLKDRNGYGAGIGVLVNAGTLPNVAEYEVEDSVAGDYQLDLRYASGDPRPVNVILNGETVLTGAAGSVTGGFFPPQQRWELAGVVPLRPGKNVVRLERDGPFPHLDKLLLTPRKPGDPRMTLDEAAARAGLVPAFLAQAEHQIREAGAKAEPALRFSLPSDPLPVLVPAFATQLQKLGTEIAALDKSRPVAPKAMGVSEGAPTDLKVHVRGSYLTLGKECPRGFPVVLAGDRQPRIPAATSGRLELARWMTQPEHPLTGRVFVNRVWRWHFGRGIVPSVDNFGKLGDSPTHPALLDWLAAVFVSTPASGREGMGERESGSKGEASTREASHSPTRQFSHSARRDGASSGYECGWSLKNLHRLIVLSNTYRMSSRYDARAARVDPGNALHWRNDRRRLDAEEIRDSILAVSGGLDRTMGGSLLNFKEREYVTSTANADPVNYRANRRSVYLPVIRSALYDVYTAFDFGDPSVMNGDRPTTTVAPQALFIMNSPLVLERTRALAAELLAVPELDDAGRVRRLYERCFSRPATPAEVSRSLDLVARAQSAWAASEADATKRRERAWQSLCKALLATNEFVYVD